MSIERIKSEQCTESTYILDKHSDNLNAYFLPKSDRGTSIHPVIVPARFP